MRTLGLLSVVGVVALTGCDSVLGISDHQVAGDGGGSGSQLGSALPVGAADFARYVAWLPAMNLP